MWPFNKKRVPDPSEDPGNAWALAEAEDESGRTLLRYNEWTRKLIGHPNYQYQVGVAIPRLIDDGAPSEPTVEQLEAFEDDLMRSLSDGRLAILVAVITMPRMREFVLYTRDHVAAMTAIEGLRQRTEGLIVQAVCQHDPKWKVFTGLVP
ncbi:MAG: DUF695 domain-containing protein [Phycisphaeraceae bacterium]|nr:DUF695 domain-containing protein [Phycisphaeraceae bacterium]